jgi:hypothetical protein
MARRSTHAELAETLDRVLHKGAVLRGDVVLSVADVDLLYLDVRVFLSSVDTALDAMALRERPLASEDRSADSEGPSSSDASPRDES